MRNGFRIEGGREGYTEKSVCQPEESIEVRLARDLVAKLRNVFKRMR